MRKWWKSLSKLEKIFTWVLIFWITMPIFWFWVHPIFLTIYLFGLYILLGSAGLFVLVVSVRKMFTEKGYFIEFIMRIISLICFVLGFVIFNSPIEETFLDIEILNLFEQNFSMRHILMIIFILFGIVFYNIKETDQEANRVSPSSTSNRSPYT